MAHQQGSGEKSKCLQILFCRADFQQKSTIGNLPVSPSVLEALKCWMALRELKSFVLENLVTLNTYLGGSKSCDRKMKRGMNGLHLPKTCCLEKWDAKCLESHMTSLLSPNRACSPENLLRKLCFHLVKKPMLVLPLDNRCV